MARRKRESRRKRKDWFGKGKRGRKILIGVAIAFASLVLFGVIGYFQLLSWLQGDGFREQMCERTRKSMQADVVEIPQNLTIQGSRVSLPAFRMERKGFFSALSAKRISSDIERSALLDRELKFGKLTVEELSFSMDAAGIGEEPPEEEPGESSFWDRFTPHTTTIAAFECKDTDVNFFMGGERYGLSGASVSAAPKGKEVTLVTLYSSKHPTPNQQKTKRTADAWQLDFENGRVRTPLYYLQDCSVKSATLLFSAGDKESTGLYNLSDCRIQLSPGELNLKGAFDGENKLWSTSLNVSKANVGRVLQGDWKKKLTGELFGSLKLTGKGPEISEAKGSVRLRNGVLEGLPVLSEIELGNTRPFRTIALAKAECQVSYPFNAPSHNISKAWLFDSIDIRSKDDILRTTGYVIIGSDGSLGGTLCIGVSREFLGKYGLDDDETLSELFTGKGDKGYRWINLNLSGTLTNPQEDLSVRITTIMRQALPQLAGKAIRGAGDALINLISGDKKKAKPAKQPQQEEPLPQEEDTEQDDVEPPPAPHKPAPSKKGLLDHATEGAGEIIDTGLNILF